MNDPERRNAFSMPMRIALLNTFRALEADQTVRAVVFTGGDKAFCVGGDVTAMGHQPMGAALDRMRIVHDLVRLLAQSSKPLIAAIEGWAVGGGLSLALLCDTIVASESARFKAGFGEIGMAPDTGILHTLPARVGTGRARQILLYNEVFSARQAVDWGVIDVVVPTGGALQEATRPGEHPGCQGAAADRLDALRVRLGPRRRAAARARDPGDAVQLHRPRRRQGSVLREAHALVQGQLRT